MGTIVEKDEDTCENGGRRHGQHESDPVGIAMADSVDHQPDQGKIRDECVEELQDHFAKIPLRVPVGGLIPIRFFYVGCDKNGIK